ncbi:hypothetical protein [Paenibacillus puerhi]|uniref:hypothetical protein n=1 Tax=Paenibacillus puerhi TaxID=2692622 RepID=UPI00135C3C8F|nr:hypothetical protein [Paenibacillus puerhi]
MDRSWINPKRAETMKGDEGMRSARQLSEASTRAERQGAAPTIIWESRRGQGNSSGEATVHELYTGQGAEGEAGPVIRVTSSGFGQQMRSSMSGRLCSAA